MTRRPELIGVPPLGDDAIETENREVSFSVSLRPSLVVSRLA
jgi:hypothetical protein